MNDRLQTSDQLRRHLLREVLVSLGILALVLVCLGNALRDPLRLIQEDVALECQGLHAVTNEQISQGRFPQWNPYGLGGERLFADIHLALLYPGSILLRILPFPTAVLWTWVIHYWATALSTYAFGRLVMRLTAPAALLGGVVFALGGFALGHSNHLNFVLAMPYLPLLLLAVSRHHETTGRASFFWWLLGVFCLSCQVLSGGTPVLILSLVSLAWLLAVIIVADLRGRDYHRVCVFLLTVVLMGLCSLGLTAVQLIPTLDLNSSSARAAWGDRYLLMGGIPWRTLLCQLLAPGILGSQTTEPWGQAGHETYVFVGSVTLSLAILRFRGRDRHPAVIPLVILLTVSIILALGDTPVLRTLMALVPTIKIRQPSRFVGLAQFSLALLGAIGFHQGLTTPSRERRWLAATLCFSVFFLCVGSYLYVFRWIGDAARSPEAFEHWRTAQTPAIQQWLVGTRFLAVAKVTLQRSPLLTISMIVWCCGSLVAGIWLLSRNTRARRIVTAALGVYVVLELYFFGLGTWANQDRFPGVTDHPPPIAEFLQANLGRDRYFNAAVYMPLWENRGAIYRLANADGYVGSRLNVSREHEAVLNELHGRLNELSLFSTKYILLRKGRGVRPLVPVFENDGVVVCENPYRVPRVTFLNRIRSVGTAQEAVDLMRDPGFDPQTTGLICGTLLLHDDAFPPVEADESCRIDLWDPGHLEIEVRCTCTRWVFVGTSYDRGWTVSLDGRAVPPARTNAIFMSVEVPPGAHRISLAYSTPGLMAGTAISITTLLGLVAAMLLPCTRLRDFLSQWLRARSEITWTIP